MFISSKRLIKHRQGAVNWHRRTSWSVQQSVSTRFSTRLKRRLDIHRHPVRRRDSTKLLQTSIKLL
jgi:hypothetical protein